MERETPDVADLLRRIELLEHVVEDLQGKVRRSHARTLKPWRNWLAGARSVEAAEFIVRDPEGQRRAKLGIGSDGWVRLRLYDGSGERCASLGVASDGRVRLRLYDQAGEPRAGLAVFPDDLGEGLVLKDQAGKPCITVSLLDDGSGDLTIRNKDGEVIWKAP